ncbi:MAG: acyl-CoA dehydratase activase [Thermodesulfobacteriota bacterium]|nr:acyl-CoA dehydratase activase [Thermodesulfobacteriota bacterium]
MIVSGCDVGSLTSKAVVMTVDNGRSRIAGSAIIRSRTKPQQSAREAMQAALDKAGMTVDDIENCVGTGYGRGKIEFVNEAVSEIKCHAQGAHWLLPSARTVIDIGGQDCKAIKLDRDGKVEDFITNDKCASGTGRFLEVMAKVLNIDLSELSSLSAKSHSPMTLASTCTVWAQADVIEHFNMDVPIEDIAAGINTAMAGRVALLVNSLGVEKDVCMTGGVSKNAGVVNTLEGLIGCGIKRIRKADAQLAGAIGAAIIAAEKMAA